MPTQAIDQIQVRIDPKTKKQARKILESIGLDISGAVKMFFKQIINTGTLPLEIRDENGFTLKKARELRQAMKESNRSKKSYSSVQALMKDLLD